MPSDSPLDNLVRIGQLKRNLAEYEGVIDVDEALVAAMVRTGRTVLERTENLAPIP